MKHILYDKDGVEHATILACPFKYTVPHGMTVKEDHPIMGKKNIDCYQSHDPKCKDDVDAHAQDFAVVKDGIVQSVIVWGGAPWCPPKGTMLVPLEKWMGVGDHYDKNTDKFSMHNDRKGKQDIHKTVQELQNDHDESVLNNILHI